MTIAEKIQMSKDLIAHASKRAIEVFKVEYPTINFYDYPDNIEFGAPDECATPYLCLRFQENIRHDSPDYRSISMTDKELEMSEDDWTAHIQKLDQDAKDNRAAEKERKEKAKHDEKLRDFNRLKNELFPEGKN